MKRLFWILMLPLVLCGCSHNLKPPALCTEFTYNTVVTTDEFTYNAIVKYQDDIVYITPTTTNAAGMTISANGNTVTFSKKDMTYDADALSVSPYNPALLIQKAISNSYSANVERVEDKYILCGKMDIGSYTLICTKSGDLLSLEIPSSNIKFLFNT